MAANAFRILKPGVMVDRKRFGKHLGRDDTSRAKGSSGPAALDFFDEPAPAPKPGKRQRPKPAEKNDEARGGDGGQEGDDTSAPAAGQATVHSSPPSDSEADGDARTNAEALRERVGIKVRGTHPPHPAASFADMEASFFSCAAVGSGLAAEGSSAMRAWRSCSRAVEASLYKEPTAVQMQVIPALLAGRDVLASAPTGSGKTAAFLLPIIGRLRCRQSDGPRAVILAPTRELVQQITREGRRLSKGTGLRISELTRAAAHGAYGASVAAGTEPEGHDPAGSDTDSDEGGGQEEKAGAAGDQRTGKHQSKRRKGGPKRPKKLEKQRVPNADVLVTTPQRLAWLVQPAEPASASSSSSSSSSSSLALPHVGIVVLDEADRLLKPGDHSGLAALDSVLAQAPPTCQRALLSATVHSGVEEAADAVLRDPVSVVVGRAMAAASTVKQKLVFVGREAGKLLELRQMARRGFDPPVLVFLQSKERAEDACHELCLDGVRAEVIHSGKAPAEREDVIRRFRSGDVWMLLATEVVARGLDFKAVRTVVNFDVPTTVSEYVHRVGRTGRAGRTGTAITLFTEADFPLMRPIANVAKLSGSEVQPWLLTLARPSGKRKARGVKRAPVSKERDHERYLERVQRRQTKGRKRT